MDSFWVAARVVVPMAIMMGIGMLLRITKVTDRPTMKKVDKVSFSLFLPMLMFNNTYDTDFSKISADFILYAVAGSFLLFLFALFVIPRFEKNPPSAAALGNVMVRANYMMYSTAIATNLYGDADLGVIMLLGAITIPVTNAMSAIILEVARAGKASPAKLLKAIVTNPLVIAAAIGLTINFSGIKLPDMITGVIDDIAGLATPLSFLSLGVSLDFGTVAGNKKRLAVGLLVRMIIFPLIFMGGAIALGFTGMALCGLLVLFAGPPAVSSYPMAVAMGADPELAGQMVIFPTLLSLITIFLWVLGLSSFGLL